MLLIYFEYFKIFFEAKNMKYFIYFSATGNGDYLATLLKEYGYTPIKVEMLKPMKKVGFWQILKYGGRAMMGKKEKIKDIDLSLKDDDVVVIGSPIWNDRLSTPISTVLAKFDLNKENTNFILYPAGEGTKKSLNQIAKLGFKNQPIVISYPLKKQEQAKELLKQLAK